MMNNLDNKIADHEKTVLDLTSDVINHDADGVIFVEKSNTSDFKMNYFNKDGTGDALCGNGLRCTVKFINDNLISEKKDLKIEAVNKIYYCKTSDDDQISVLFPPPTIIKSNFKLKVHFQDWWELLNCSYVECGSPHIVVFIDEIQKPRISSLDEININEWGRNIRMHKDLLPDGANVNFVKVLSKERGEIEIRSYERGVEGETLACGTGALSSALIFYLIVNEANPVQVLTRSKEYLTIEFNIGEENLLGITMTGNACRYK